MKLCVGVPNSMHVAAMTQPWEHGLSGADIARVMKVVDELGYWKAMAGEHFVIPTDHLELSGDHYFHTPVALSFVAGATRNIKVSSSVTLVALQNPIVQAKAWATLDFLSGGRAICMIGVGWLKKEFDILGVPFHERGALCEEYVAAMQELWRSDRPTFEGKYISFKDVATAPKPIQPGGVPVWFGGDADPVLKRVARYGSGWSPFQTPPDKFVERIDFIKSQPEYDGRKLDIFYTLSMRNVGEAHAVLNSPDAVGLWDAQKIIDQCAGMAALGVTETMVPLPPIRDIEEYLDRMRWLAAEVMPAVA